MNTKNIVYFFYEMGMLKRETHRGVMLAGVKHPDTIGEHSLRAALIGYILAELEGANPEKVCTMLVIHDIGECRVGDQHKVASRYYDHRPVEQKAFEDQLKNLPRVVEKKWKQLFKEYNLRNSKEGIVAKDADWLEMAVSAKEYVEQGYKGVGRWIDNIAKALETKSAKKLLGEIKKQKTYDWWKGIQEMTYKEIYY